MSPPALEPGVLELIIGNLFDERKTLKNCCVVSKSWVPLARQYLFHTIEFDSYKLRLWKKAFPDPSNSPALHTRYLDLSGRRTVIGVGRHADPCIRSFCNVLGLILSFCAGESQVQPLLVPYHGFSPNLKYLSLNFHAPFQELFDLVCSFPSLEELYLNIRSTDNDTVTDERKAPSNSPTLAGSHELHGEVRSVAWKWPDLPNTLHKVSVTMAGDVKSASLTSDLLSKCSDTLEFLNIRFPTELDACCSAAFTFNQTPCLTESDTELPKFDLSKFKNLIWPSFSLGQQDVKKLRWVTATLQTAKSKNLQMINIHLYFDPVYPVEKTLAEEWRVLESLLIRLLTSRSIRPRIIFRPWTLEDDVPKVARDFVPRLWAMEEQYVDLRW